MFIKIGIFATSLFIMLLLSKYLVDAMIHFSRRLKISEFFVGSVILALGTSMPEFIDNIVSSSIGIGELGLGNIIGSNIVNITLVLGLTALIKPISNIGKKATRESLIPLAAALLYVLVAYDGVISRLNGLVLLAAFLLYQLHFRDKSLKVQRAVYIREIQADIFLTPIAIFTIIICGWLVVNTGASISSDIGIPLSIFGLSILAVSTALPEMSASIISALKGHSKIGLGTILGSNTINLLLIGGVAALIRPIVLDNKIVILSSLALLIGTHLILFGFVKTRRNITNKEGLILLSAYIIYLTFLIVRV